jgi:signal transduction histidine kinase
MSDIVWSLNPKSENAEQLQYRMKAVAETILVPHKIIYEVMTDDNLISIQLTGEQRKNIFLIFKEALHNIVKYADCKMVYISLSLANNKLTMAVKDDGIGFNVSQTATEAKRKERGSLGGNGLKNMHARASDLNATVLIYSAINEGTTILLILPV